APSFKNYHAIIDSCSVFVANNDGPLGCFRIKILGTMEIGGALCKSYAYQQTIPVEAELTATIEP
ncbi:MAG: hypothetical protein ACOYKN_17000, partial [Pirellula sp.]